MIRQPHQGLQLCLLLACWPYWLAYWLPQVMLLGGDAVEDDVVNILDLTLIGGHYGMVCGAPLYRPQADINDDCRNDIADVTLIGGNYLRTSSVLW